jgi:predicted Zn-dependent protease
MRCVNMRENEPPRRRTNLTGRIVGTLLFGQAGDVLGAAGSNLLTLKFSRDDEREADLVGMELAARAGYDPAAGITLWEKMSAAARGATAVDVEPSGQRVAHCFDQGAPERRAALV